MCPRVQARHTVSYENGSWNGRTRAGGVGVARLVRHSYREDEEVPDADHGRGLRGDDTGLAEISSTGRSAGADANRSAVSPASSLDPKLFDETAAVALFAGPEHRLVYQNAACCRMLGARPLGLPAREAFPEPDAAEFMTVLDDVVATGRPRQILESREPDPGAVEQARYFVYSCTPVTLPGGPGAMVVAMDTTAETMALQRYEALVSAVSQMVWVVRADGSAEEVVPSWQELTGSPWRGWIDDDRYAYIHPRDREGLGRAWRTAAAQEPPAVMEATFRVRTTDGSYRHMSTRCVPILHHGRAKEWVAATDDVEETWRATLREHVLARVAEVAAGSLEEVFAAVVRTVVPELADSCVALLLSHEEWPLP